MLLRVMSNVKSAPIRVFNIWIVTVVLGPFGTDYLNVDPLRVSHCLQSQLIAPLVCISKPIEVVLDHCPTG